MKKVVFLTLFALLSFTIIKAQNPSAGEYPVENILNQIQVGLQKIQDELDDADLPPLSSVDLTLESYWKKEAGGKFKLLIFSFGKKWEKEISHQLSIKMIPPKPNEETSISGDKNTIAKSLVDLILSAAKGINKASDSKIPLVAKSISATIKFTITNTNEGGLTYAITPITGELSGKLNNKAIHKMVITYAVPD